MRSGKFIQWGLRICAMAVVLLRASQPAFACATCYTSALGAKGIQALKSGILILLLPTVAIFGTLMLLTFRYRNSCPSWRRAAPADEAPMAGSDLELLGLPSYETDPDHSRAPNSGILPIQ